MIKDLIQAIRDIYTEGEFDGIGWIWYEEDSKKEFMSKYNLTAEDIEDIIELIDFLTGQYI